MIGIFDSGVGGMTVAHAVEQFCPGRALIYFGDLARTPYGSKSPAVIRRYARQNIDFLLAHGARMIIIACNSAASVAAEDMRREFSVPIFDVIGPAVRRAAEISSAASGRIGVIGTRATINSAVYPRKIGQINQDLRVYGNECPLLVPLVEEGWLNRRETRMILRYYLRPLKMQQVDTLVLGCTHYPLLRDLIQPRIGKRVRIVDSSIEVARELRQYLDNHPEYAATTGGSKFYVSDMTPAAAATARRIFGRPIELQVQQAGG